MRSTRAAASEIAERQVQPSSTRAPQSRELHRQKPWSKLAVSDSSRTAGRTDVPDAVRSALGSMRYVRSARLHSDWDRMVPSKGTRGWPIRREAAREARTEAEKRIKEAMSGRAQEACRPTSERVNIILLVDVRTPRRIFRTKGARRMRGTRARRASSALVSQVRRRRYRLEAEGSVQMAQIRTEASSKRILPGLRQEARPWGPPSGSETGSRGRASSSRRACKVSQPWVPTEPCPSVHGETHEVLRERGPRREGISNARLAASTTRAQQRKRRARHLHVKWHTIGLKRDHGGLKPDPKTEVALRGADGPAASP